MLDPPGDRIDVSDFFRQPVDAFTVDGDAALRPAERLLARRLLQRDAVREGRASIARPATGPTTTSVARGARADARRPPRRRRRAGDRARLRVRVGRGRRGRRRHRRPDRLHARHARGAPRARAARRPAPRGAFAGRRGGGVALARGALRRRQPRDVPELAPRGPARSARSRASSGTSPRSRGPSGRSPCCTATRTASRRTPVDAAYDFVSSPPGRRASACSRAAAAPSPPAARSRGRDAFLDPSQPPASSQVFLDAVPKLKRLPTDRALDRGRGRRRPCARAHVLRRPLDSTRRSSGSSGRRRRSSRAMTTAAPAGLALEAVAKAWDGEPALDGLVPRRRAGRAAGGARARRDRGSRPRCGSIAGLEAPDAGVVRIGGRDVTGVDPSERGVAMVFQSFALFPHLSARRTSRSGCGRAGRRAPRRCPRAAEVGRAARACRRCWSAAPRSSRGGERQRVALARALVGPPVGAAARRAALQPRRAPARRGARRGPPRAGGRPA